MCLMKSLKKIIKKWSDRIGNNVLYLPLSKYPVANRDKLAIMTVQ